MVKPYTFLKKRHDLSLCCWELCTARSGVAMLHCLLNWQFPHSRASLSSTSCQGPFWWHHHCCHSHCGPSPLGKRVSRTAAHPYLLVHCPNTEVSPITSPCSFAFAAADYTWWLHLNHIQFNFLLSPQRHATLTAKHSTSGCTPASLCECIHTLGTLEHTRVDKRA